MLLSLNSASADSEFLSTSRFLTSSSSSSRSCPSGQFVDRTSGQCKPCSFGCTDCSDLNTCNHCKEGLWLHPQDKNCNSCHSSCYSCTGPSETQCSKCAVWRKTVDKSTQTCKCSNGFWEDPQTGRCKECHYSCSSCTGPLHSDCGGCKANMLLVLLDVTSRNHGMCSCSKEGAFLAGMGSCLGCHPDCKTCYGHSRDSCITCANPSQQIQSNGFCGCNSGTFLDHTTKNCVKCSENCEECQSTNSCSKCLHGFVNNNGQCKCPSGMYFDDVLGLCNKCGPMCQSCTNELKCNECEPGVATDANGNCGCPNKGWIYIASQKQCVEKCSKGYYDETVQECISCTDSNCMQCQPDNQAMCLKCRDPYILDGSSCVTECPVSKFFEIKSKGIKECSACSAQCQTCETVETYCTACASGMILDDNQCHKPGECNPGYFYTNSKCIACAPGCKTCSGPKKSDCLSCGTDTMFEAGYCKPCEEFKGWKTVYFPSAKCEPICGDGILRGSEVCDDGNNNNGDGCSNSCQFEADFYCENTSPDVPTLCVSNVPPVAVYTASTEDPSNIIVEFNRPMKEAHLCDMNVIFNKLAPADYDVYKTVSSNKSCWIHIDYHRNEYGDVALVKYDFTNDIEDIYNNSINATAQTFVAKYDGYIFQTNNIDTVAESTVLNAKVLFWMAFLVAMYALPLVFRRVQGLFWNSIDFLQRLSILYIVAGIDAHIPITLNKFFEAIQVFNYTLPQSVMSSYIETEYFQKTFFALFLLCSSEIFNVLLSMSKVIAGERAQGFQTDFELIVRSRIFYSVSLNLLMNSCSSLKKYFTGNPESDLALVTSFAIVSIYAVVALAKLFKAGCDENEDNDEDSIENEIADVVPKGFFDRAYRAFEILGKLCIGVILQLNNAQAIIGGLIAFDLIKGITQNSALTYNSPFLRTQAIVSASGLVVIQTLLLWVLFEDSATTSLNISWYIQKVTMIACLGLYTVNLHGLVVGWFVPDTYYQVELQNTQEKEHQPVAKKVEEANNKARNPYQIAVDEDEAGANTSKAGISPDKGIEDAYEI